MTKVFVSSTYLDNAERRERVERAIMRAEMTPIGMERFTAANAPLVDECVRMARECDVLVGIVAWRYGVVPDGYESSITELEYEAAEQKLMFVLADDAPIKPRTDLDADRGAYARVCAFRERVLRDRERMAGWFTDDQLEAQVLDALVRWKTRREEQPERERRSEPPDVTAAPENVEIDGYRAAIRAHFSAITLMGFETHVRVPLKLEDLYVPLTGRIELRRARGDEPDSALGGEEMIQLAHAFAEAKKREGRRGVVILGTPGSGKTTHLKRLLLWAAGGRAQTLQELGLPSNCLPVLLPLRHRTGEIEIEALIERQLAAEPLSQPPGFGKRLLQRGNLALLVDGLDEVPGQTEREAIARSIARILSKREDVHIAITCRHAGFTVEKLLEDTCAVFELSPLSREDADRFIRNWFEAVETALDAQDPARARKLAGERANELIKRLGHGGYRAARVVEMARNPLLLTAICLVHRDRGQLPDKRAELLEECVNVLLELWRKQEKKLEVAVDAARARQVLEPMALFLHQEEQRTQASSTELEPVLQPYLRDIRWEGVNARDFLATIRDESGLLTGFGGERYGFLHLAFQEYLAAHEIRNRAYRDKSVLRELAKRFGQSWWREVTLLLLALKERGLFEDFMSELVQLPEFALHGELVDDCLLDAFHRSLEPFERLFRDPRGDAATMWKRQFLALSAIRRFDPQRWRELIPEIAAHRDHRLRAHVLDEVYPEEQQTIRSPRGDIEFVHIQGGTFMMGSPETESEHRGDELLHEVTLSSFYLGRTPVTNAEYAVFLTNNPSAMEPGYWSNAKYNRPDQPVVGVSWHEARTYCRWAQCELPTEAQWEYACRGGTTSRFSSGDTAGDLDRVGWYVFNSRGCLSAVAQKQPNAYGLYDMHGNVREWCRDWFASYDPRAQMDPIGPSRGALKVTRGGSFRRGAPQCRSAYRYGNDQSLRWLSIGFRVAMPASPSAR